MIPTKIHGVLDYIVGVLLILAPFVLGFASLTSIGTWIPVLVGGGAILYSLLTRYELGLVPIIPMPTHLGLDVVGGLVLAVSPWLFGFANVIWWPHLLVGVMEVGLALMTSRVPSYDRGTMRHA